VVTGRCDDPANGPASTAKFSDPHGPGGVFYILSGGESGVVYNQDGTVNLHAALTMACVNGNGSTSVTASSQLGTNEVGYSCAASIPGTEVNGVIIVSPNNTLFTWKELTVTMLPSQHSLATQILNSFKMATS